MRVLKVPGTQRARARARAHGPPPQGAGGPPARFAKVSKYFSLCARAHRFKNFTRARVRCVAADVVEAGLLWRPSAIKFYGMLFSEPGVFICGPDFTSQKSYRSIRFHENFIQNQEEKHIDSYHFEKVHSFSGSSSSPGSTIIFFFLLCRKIAFFVDLRCPPFVQRIEWAKRCKMRLWTPSQLPIEPRTNFSIFK